MKDLILGEINYLEFDRKIILSIDQKWLEYFNTNHPKFHSIIKDGKYMLVGPDISVRPAKQNITEQNRNVSSYE